MVARRRKNENIRQKAGMLAELESKHAFAREHARECSTRQAKKLQTIGSLSIRGDGSDPQLMSHEQDLARQVGVYTAIRWNKAAKFKNSEQ